MKILFIKFRMESYTLKKKTKSDKEVRGLRKVNGGD